MKTAAIIAEFNPFHNGHALLVNETRKKCGADHVVAFMSGDFVQRGAPAICDKFLRAEAAVRSGVDAVFELPAVYAVSAAPDFAFGGVSLAESLGCTDILAFGSECGDLAKLETAASLLSEEPKFFKAALNDGLKSGLSYPAAVSDALRKADPALSGLPDSPNNTLGIEYLKSLKRLSSSIEPFTIKRRCAEHGETGIREDASSSVFYSSAKAIRNAIISGGDNTEFIKCMPKNVSSLLIPLIGKGYPVTSSDLSVPMAYLFNFLDPSDIDLLPGNSDLKARLKKKYRSVLSYDELKSSLKGKNFTETSVARLIIQAFLGIKDRDIDRVSGPKYLRLLAMNRASSGLLKKIKEKAHVPLITKMADFDFSSSPMLLTDIRASDIYMKIGAQKYNTPYVNDIEHSPVII